MAVGLLALPPRRGRDGVPATLFTIFDGDTRSTDARAQDGAEMQWATSAPIAARASCCRREKDVGHGARAISRTIALTAEQSLTWRHTAGGCSLGRLELTRLE